MPMEAISSLTCANRVEIFRHLAVDQSQCVDLKILDSIACENYHAFSDFCEQVFAEKDRIQDISCSFEDKELKFNIMYQS